MSTKNLTLRESGPWVPSSDALGSISYKTSPLTVAEHDDVHKFLYLKSAIQYLNDVSLSGIASKDILIWNGSVWKNYPLSGDVSMTTGGVVTVNKVNNQTMSFSGGFATVGGHSITLTTTNTTSLTLPTSGTLMNDSLTSGYMYMGSTSNIATGYEIDSTGDVTASIVSSKIKFIIGSNIANSNISNSAAISWSKLATGTSSRVLVTNGSGVITTSSVTSTELSYLSGVTPGTLSGSRAVVVNASGEIDTIKLLNVDIDNININGNNIISTNTNGNIYITPNGTGKTIIDDCLITTQIDVDGYDIILDSDGDTKVVSSSDDTIILYINGSNRLSITDSLLQPTTTNTFSIGDSSHVIKNLYVGDIYVNGGTISSSSSINISVGSTGSISVSAGGGGSIVLGGVNDYISIGSSSSLLSFFGNTPTSRSTGWVITNFTSYKTLDADTTNINEVADTLATLINELIVKGLIDGTVS